MPTGTKARPRIDPAAHQRLRDAAADALEWLLLVRRQDWFAVLIARGLTPGCAQESREILTRAIEALEAALEEGS